MLALHKLKIVGGISGPAFEVNSKPKLCADRELRGEVLPCFFHKPSENQIKKVPPTVAAAGINAIILLSCPYGTEYPQGPALVT